jgi:pimeloyl-ACP methyl ester carboxylesterase
MSSPAGRTATFRHEGHKLSYAVYGDGPRTTVLLHGLLLSKRMHGPLADELARRGNRVLTLDLLGHGRSDRPEEMWNYGMQYFARNVVGLLDHLEIDEAVVGGTSLGANVTLEVAALAPDRLRGMVVEMPVLDNALLGCALAFTPLMVGLTLGERAWKVAQAGARMIPNRRLPFLLDIGVEWMQQDPAPSAGVIQGLFFGRTAPPREERRTFQTPSLVIGHRRDPIHPFSDSGMLVDELPNGRLLEADSILEMRIAPDRLTDEISDFIADCWKPREAAATPRRQSGGPGRA